ncbi:proline--tRNA ligase [Treponema endosymbiont of Eucomonympha sp.]|uniref:proline--tRNA ligase n=1 Tax=Treponema endosymbiont of Eucomonympha sp. TaxID=1580831 RepID=UPI00078374DE|nr:proline--tRNA ligase [Treponema endosymbiont of Eucomonympha sp.]
MKMSQTLPATLRDAPAEAVIASHRLMLRAGLLRKLGNGLFAYLPLGLRAYRKVETIIREEMDAIGALEIKPTVLVPGELWRESGRWDTMGAGMLRVTNRVGQELVVSPTAEEAATALVRDELASYKQLPLTVYQLNTKYRDEIRPRYGVMRGREFTMMDAYSYHADEASLGETYERFAAAYRRLFARCGLSVLTVRADSGQIGGSDSEEFMVESAVGDDTLILCPKCGYAANDEKAACADDAPEGAATALSIEEIDTPSVRTIAELAAFLHIAPRSFIKTLIYRAENCALDLSAAPGGAGLKREPNGGVYPEAFFAVCMRGDLDVNEAKLAALLKAGGVSLACDADVERITGAPVGFAGPAGLDSVPVVADKTALALHDAATGALKKDRHYIHVEPGRDFTPFLMGDVRTAKAGDRCPACGSAFYAKKGNELGHIFKLGSLYTTALRVTYLDANGERRTPIMGTYGIGVDRTLASVIEEHHDEAGIVWPLSVAPYQVVIVPVKYEGEMKAAADRLYGELRRRRVEALLDDRNERPGVKFTDSDLIGIPLRVVAGKSLPKVEIRLRGTGETELADIDAAPARIAGIIADALAALRVRQ